MKTPTREEMRAHIEKALRAQAPGDYAKPNNPKDPENDAFLVLRGYQGKEILFFCDSEVASVQYGPAAKHFDFATEDEDEEEEKDDDLGGPAGFGENMLSESMGDAGDDDEDLEDDEDDDDDEPAKETFSEDDLRALLKGIVQTTLDITQEKVFAAEYKKGFARVARFHGAREYEAVKGMKDFKSMSWKGKYTSG